MWFLAEHAALIPSPPDSPRRACASTQGEQNEMGSALMVGEALWFQRGIMPMPRRSVNITKVLAA